MLSINTNLQSIIVQNNLTKSTTGLNQAIERMTTGFKINHASDNAANYSISQNMSSKISSYNIAEDNAMMGLDMIQTVSSNLETISNLSVRLRNLAVQAANGTYGQQSIDSINQEAKALTTEISRLVKNTEYNGVNLLDAPQSNEGKTIGLTQSAGTYAIERRDTSGMISLSGVNSASRLSSGTYSISSADELAKLAEMTNNGLIGQNCEFVLGADIDLSAYSSGEGWTPIGYNGTNSIPNDNQFNAVFDGNGYTISNLYINRPSAYKVGLFGCLGNSGEIINVNISNANLTGYNKTGALLGASDMETLVKNCSALNVNIHGLSRFTGGLIGLVNGNVSNCSVSGNVKGDAEGAGGLCGSIQTEEEKECFLSNSFSSCNVFSESYQVGGLVGYAGINSNIINSYASGDIQAKAIVGGLVGSMERSTIKNCYASGDVHTSSKEPADVLQVGGLIGQMATSVCCDSFSTCNVTAVGGSILAGGFVGTAYNDYSIDNCYSTGNLKIENSSDTANIRIGGFAGNLGTKSGAAFGGTLDSCYTISNINIDGIGTENARIGGFAGDILKSIVTNSKSDNVISGANTAGGFAGYVRTNSNIENCTYSYNKDAYFSFDDAVATETNVTSSQAEFQVGVTSEDSSQICFNSQSLLLGIESLSAGGMNSCGIQERIDKFLSNINSMQVKYGALENRLTSVLEQISVNYDNLTSSRSTLRDADVAKESSQYIKNQILQQAAATLLATANQTPSIALQLL